MKTLNIHKTKTDFFLASPGVSRRSLFSPDSPRSPDPKFILAYILVKNRLKYKPKQIWSLGF
jgi:hypothetical protein